MSNYLNLNIPTFLAYLDTGFLYNEEPNYKNDAIPVEVFNFTSIPQRCGLFSVMTEWGTQHARVPIHYLRATPDATTTYPLDWLQLWDNMSYYASAGIYDYLKNRTAMIMLKDKTRHKSKYMFTIDWCLGPQYHAGYGEMAAGHKCAHVFEGEGGQFFMQPNNRLLWLDGGAWISKELTKPDWKVFGLEFSCESTGSRWVSESDEELYFYDFKEKA